MGLYDAVLLKDNHWASGSDVLGGIKAVRSRYPGMPVELEAADFAQLRCALAAQADVILLDNMPSSKLQEAVRIARRISPKTELEISGGVKLENVRALARLGCDRISVGRITHSSPAFDLSLEVP